jgi:transcriptional regulator with GAF, ATPase, and Fis domain
MKIQVWIRYQGQDFSTLYHSVDEALAAAGISICQHAEDTAQAFGILFFDEIDERLYELIEETSQRGLRRILAITPNPEVLRKKEIWRLLQAGASDVLVWQDPEQAASSVVARLKRWSAVEQIVTSQLVQRNLVGQSQSWRSVLRGVVEIACFTDASMLILGESGTGKELVARLIHTLDSRATKKDLVVLDCSTLVPDLVGSEFFGHERGAFTGAIGPRDGAFALAHNGSLFLDEIGELPLGLQPQLLRVIQEHVYKRVGGNTWQRVDFRLICATNRNLTQAVEHGHFRADLYYRIASWVCSLPALRERREDILPLTYQFMAECRPGKTPVELDEPVRRFLLQRDYPGNVRELRQLVSRICYRHVGTGPITLGDIPEDDRPSAEFSQTDDWHNAQFEDAIRHALNLGVGLKEIGRTTTETAIRIAVGDEGGNLHRAASKLGVTDRALQMRRANRRQPNLTCLDKMI